jgi:lysylphosphatidylglycerol synthetase-like protein (DUF2156 family)
VTSALDRPARDRFRRRAALGIALMGLVDLASGVTPPFAGRLHVLRGWVPLTVPQASTVLVTAAGVALVLLGGGVRRGHRRAWALSIGLLVLSAVLHVAKGLDVEEAVVALGLAVHLARRPECFPAPSCPERTRRGLATIGIGAATATATAGGVLWVDPRLHHHLSIGTALAAAGERLVGVTTIPVPGRAGAFLTPGMAAVGLSLVAVAAWLAFRPMVAHHAATSGAGRAREIVARHGGGSLDYFALRDDKLHFVSGESLVAYSLQGGTCLVSPDPIGPEADRARAWHAFRAFAEGHGWPVAVLGASESWLATYAADGMRSLYVGDEAVVDPTTFTIDGGKAKGLRHAVNRAEKAGYRFELRDPAFLEPELEVALRRVLEGSRRGGVERGYAMTLGRVFDPADRGLLLGIAFEPSGEPAAFCQFVPAPSSGGWSLDLMRRSDRDHPNSITDYVVVSTILAIQRWGATSLVHNFATLRAVLDGAADDTWSNRVQGAVARQLSGSMQIESLWKHNAKYRPAWQARDAVYDGAKHILPSAVAVARAESFFDLPVIGRFFRAPRPAPAT